MMPTVELVYDRDCPNVAEARTQLERALAEVGLRVTWKEWNLESSDCPKYAQQYGSPTILVNGLDVEGNVAGVTANCCRIYSDRRGHLKGVPSVEQITSALQLSQQEVSKK
jgi:hypothetical protein